MLGVTRQSERLLNDFEVAKILDNVVLSPSRIGRNCDQACACSMLAKRLRRCLCKRSSARWRANTACHHREPDMVAQFMDDRVPNFASDVFSGFAEP